MERSTSSMLNNLGGYRLGTGQTDNVLQTIVTDESVFGASGSYPGEGGWIYFTPVGYATYAYQLRVQLLPEYLNSRKLRRQMKSVLGALV
jgi:hypothetical protein